MENQRNNVVANSSHVPVPNNVLTYPSHVFVPDNVVAYPSHVSFPNNVVAYPSHVSFPNNVVTTPSHVPVVGDIVYETWNNNIVNLSSLSDEEYFRIVPPGYRFKPHDWELIVHYLRRKINNETLPRNKIYDVDLYKCDPEQLANIHRKSGDEIEWYFFTSRDRKYTNGSRPNRAANGGFWKATGADKIIKHNGEEIGFRKALVFYAGKPPDGQKTSWIMHEFRLKNAPVHLRTSADDKTLDDCILCKIYKKVRKPKNDGNEQGDGDNPEEAGGNENEGTPPIEYSSIQVENSLASTEMENTLIYSQGSNVGNGNNYTRQFNNVVTHGFLYQNPNADAAAAAAAQMRLQNIPSMGSYMNISSTWENAGTLTYGYGHAPVPLMPPVPGTTMMPSMPSSWLPNENYVAGWSENAMAPTNPPLQMPYGTQDLPLMGNYVTDSENAGTFSDAAQNPLEPPDDSFIANYLTIPDIPTGINVDLTDNLAFETDEEWEYILVPGRRGF